jgi:hypothetical protein
LRVVKSGQGISYSAVAYEKLYQKPQAPLPELCTRPISRPIVYPDTSWEQSYIYREP